jgi:two-component system CheB/CheR fusion protein
MTDLEQRSDDGSPEEADPAQDRSVTLPSDDPAEFEELLEYLRKSRGVDLTGYKRVSLMRRIRKRMGEVGVGNFVGFEEYLELHPDEFQELFSELLINVTSFFRDPDAWAALSSQVVAPMLARKAHGERIRIWSAGCASGEEAYTLAILLAETMGEEDFRKRVKIYATDADEAALLTARQGIYDVRHMRGLSTELRGRYFERTRDDRFAFRTDLRRALIFGRHDLMYDPPISRIDILACRNVLMYFNAESQNRILGRFAMALNGDGVLFLGRAETLLSRTGLFAPLDLKRRLFRRAGTEALGDRIFAISGDRPRVTRESDESSMSVRSRDAAFDAGAVAQIVVDTRGALALANAQARALLALAPSDLGRPLQDFEFSYRPLDLRSRVDEVNQTQRALVVSGVAWTAGVGGITCDVHFVPLLDERGVFVGVTISIVDTSKHSRLQRELEHAHQSLETAYEELQSTNEELETTNEELQSVVEELETTNEELQSTNEELETMNEELQSTNEELQAINEAARGREAELDEVSGFLRSILGSLRGGIIALDRDLRVTAWNAASTEYWGLRADEVMNRHFFSLDIGLPGESLHAPIRVCLSGESALETLSIDATNRRGRPMRCEIRCLPLRHDDEEVCGVLLIIEDGTTGKQDASV